MKTIRNLTRGPLGVPLPGGKKLHLGPGQSGGISVRAAEHPPLTALVSSGALEIIDGEHHPAGAERPSGAPHPGAAHRPASRSSRRGDR